MYDTSDSMILSILMILFIIFIISLFAYIIYKEEQREKLTDEQHKKFMDKIDNDIQSIIENQKKVKEEIIEELKRLSSEVYK